MKKSASRGIPFIERRSAVSSRSGTANSATRTRLVFSAGLVVLLAAFPFSDCKAASVGKLEICKDNDEKDYDPENQPWWRAEVVVPAGMVFVDIGMTDDPSAPPIKLRIVTLQSARIAGHQKCATVSAAIANNTERFGDKFGAAYVGPLITSVAPADKRILEVEGQASTDGKLAGRKMAPYDGDLPNVQATVKTEFR